MVEYVRSDLDFILTQIKIAEAHAAGDEDSLAGLIGSPLLPYGLRTVDGTYNNLIPGREDYGAADQVFNRLVPVNLRPAENSPPQFGPSTPSSYEQTTGNVFDSEPRTISNLIVDQTANNPAAVGAHDGVTFEGDTLVIPNTTPDEGLSAPFNSWFTLFGQFFDHGLDLTTKGGSGTVFVPLKPDDPLYNPATPNSNFMVLTRATNQPGPDGVVGDNPATPDEDESADDEHEHTNTTTSWIDQNQTYTSHASHQVFLREYALNADGEPVNTGRLLDGTNGGLANWAEVKAQARDLLGINLTDAQLGNVPLLATDEYGNFMPGLNGFPQVVTINGLVEGDPTANGGLGISLTGYVGTGHAFLDDIAHGAAPIGNHDGNPTTPPQLLTPDANTVVNPAGPPLPATQYDNELLDAHKINGDGRGNENIGLTAVHHVFHSEHNRLVEHTKTLVLASGDPAFIAEWHLPDGSWDGARLFQAAKFGTEMQYQHLVFEEFGRKVQPLINLFGPYDNEVDPSIVAEFAHVVYRFGHSMLNETIDLVDANGSQSDISLLNGFLNPVAFDNLGTDEEAAGAIIRGMTRQVGNEIDEFVTDTLRNSLLGLPLDLATINMTRARDTGVPTLNAARREFFEGTNDSSLKPYDSWVEFAEHVKHPASVINFIAAYGVHPAFDAPDVDTVADKRAIATALVMGGAVDIEVTPAIPVGPGFPNGAPAVFRLFTPDDDDRLDFLNGVGAYANDLETGLPITGLEDIDFWIGGLAEAQQPFGGLLGSTFNFVFETQMEALQDGDRFYYLNRLAGTHFLTELEQNSFASLVAKNTDIGQTGMHLPGDIFSTPAWILEVDQSKQITGIDDPTRAGAPGRDDPLGGNDFNPLVIRNNPGTQGTDANYLKYTGEDHVVLGGTNPGNSLNPSGDDILISGIGDDTIWGDGGNDRIEGGDGFDILNGGDGDDVITDIGFDDNIKGGKGNDVVNSGNGFDLILLGDGDDFSIGGEDANETFGGAGNDYIIAGDDADTVFGDAGDDWIEGGSGNDLLQGDFGNPFQDSNEIGNDVIIGDGGNDDYDAESGDDIMLTGQGIERNEGMLGFDWVIGQKDLEPVDYDMDFTGLLPPDQEALRDRFDLVEGMSGYGFDDILRGDDSTTADLTALDETSGLNNALNNEEQIDLVLGLQDLLGGATSFSGGNILLGGGGSDLIEGRGGDDVIDGDSHLTVRIAVVRAGVEIASATSMAELETRMFNRMFNPGELQIIREIGDGGAEGDEDTAVFSDISTNYDFTVNADGSLRVAHTRGTATDGADTLYNMEFMRFTDITIGGDTNLITTTQFGPTPIEDGFVTAVGIFSSLQNLDPGSLDYVWEVETAPDVWTFVTSGIGATFQPGDDEVGKRLRVTATFLDLEGNPGSLTSPPTAVVANVNDEATGALAINDLTPTETLVVTVSPEALADIDGLTNATPSYQWQRLDGVVWTSIVGATAASFTPGQTEVNHQIRARLTVTDDHGALETLFSNATGVVGEHFVGAATNDNPTLTAGSDIAFGEGGNDRLDGLSGADILSGGIGNDTYYVDTADDSVMEVAVQGSDTVYASASWALAAGVSVEFLRANYGAAATGVTLTGNELANSLHGGAAADTLIGGGGNDRLDGLGGADSLSGGTGNDTYYVDTAGDSVAEAAVQGSDTVFASASWALAAGASVENLRANYGAAATGITLTGNETANMIYGGAVADTLIGGGGNDLLDGLAGADSLSGGTGNDSYYVDTAGDSVTEVAAQGSDTVFASANWALDAGVSVEFLRANYGAAATGVTLTGNELANSLHGGAAADTLTGGGGNDRLDGLGGADSLSGGTGNDSYYVDAAGDSVTELAVQGSDSVFASVSWALAADVSVETLRANYGAAATGITLTGNQTANVIYGGAVADTLIGGGGNDWLEGGAGDDRLEGGTGNDTLWFRGAGFGDDMVVGFDAAAAGGQDLMNISGFGFDAAEFAAQVSITQSGANTLVAIGADSIVLLGINALTIDQTDFALA